MDFFSRILPTLLEYLFKGTFLNGWFRKQGSNAVFSHKEQMKDEERQVIDAKTVKVLKQRLWFKNYQHRNVFTSDGGSNEKLSLRLDVLKFQK